MEKTMPRELKTQATKGKILDTIGEILDKDGYDYLTVRNICAVAGVAYGSFYYHFGSKEDLLYAFCRERLEHFLKLNPMPSQIQRENVIYRVLWAYLVYAAFCQEIGKGVIREIYTECDGDLFEELMFRPMVLEPIQEAVEKGYMVITGNRPESISSAQVMSNIHRDLAVQLKGAVLYWTTVRDRHTAMGLPYLLEGPINRFMISWVTPLYRERFVAGNYHLLSEQPWYEGSIKPLPPREK